MPRSSEAFNSSVALFIVSPSIYLAIHITEEVLPVPGGPYITGRWELDNLQLRLDWACYRILRFALASQLQQCYLYFSLVKEYTYQQRHQGSQVYTFQHKELQKFKARL